MKYLIAGAIRFDFFKQKFILVIQSDSLKKQFTRNIIFLYN